MKSANYLIQIVIYAAPPRDDDLENPELLTSFTNVHLSLLGESRVVSILDVIVEEVDAVKNGSGLGEAATAGIIVAGTIGAVGSAAALIFRRRRKVARSRIDR